MSNPQSARAATPTQARILDILAQADYRHFLRLDRSDTATLRAELAGGADDDQALKTAVRAWLGRAWIIDVGTIIIDVDETSVLKA